MPDVSMSSCRHTVVFQEVGLQRRTRHRKEQRMPEGFPALRNKPARLVEFLSSSYLARDRWPDFLGQRVKRDADKDNESRNGQRVQHPAVAILTHDSS